jgi:DNA gyrase subunit A
MVRASEFFGLATGETLIGLVELNDTNEIALATAQGTVKRVQADYPAKEQFELIALKEGDQVVSAVLANEANEYVIVTSDTQVLRFAADSVRAQGRAASGIAGIRRWGQGNCVWGSYQSRRSLCGHCSEFFGRVSRDRCRKHQAFEIGRVSCQR